jgi:tRNA-modifying protein YgfZ
MIIVRMRSPLDDIAGRVEEPDADGLPCTCAPRPDPDWGVIVAQGADAAGFLQSQLTSDVAALDAGHACFAGYCSAKGRLLASFVVWRPADETFALATSRDLLAPTLKRLSMFVLRARCRLFDASVEQPVLAALGDALPAQVRGAPSMRVVDGWLRLPDALGRARAWRVAPGDAPSSDRGMGEARPDDPPVAAGDAVALQRWLEVASGVPRITAATVDMFVPQMVNLELVGGVSFKKGCYPGQEIVARSQYRGTLKRRMHLFASPVPASPGQDLVHAADPAQPAGTVVNAASLAGAHLLLASVKSALLDDAAGSLRLGSIDGPELRRQAMPYDVPREAADV